MKTLEKKKKSPAAGGVPISVYATRVKINEREARWAGVRGKRGGSAYIAPSQAWRLRSTQTLGRCRGPQDQPGEGGGNIGSCVSKGEF